MDTQKTSNQLDPKEEQELKEVSHDQDLQQDQDQNENNESAKSVSESPKDCKQIEEGYNLVVKNKSSEEERHLLVEGKEMIVGASPGESDVLVFNDEFISDKHFSIKLENGVVTVRDLNSTNGLYLRLDEPMKITEAQKLMAGLTSFSIKESKNE